jgi:myo-inositol-1(or 4)-monophosphatase
MEESGEVGAKNAEARWIIDPLDGTLNFLHGIPHWAISVALEQAGDIVAGVIFDPVKNEMFMAEKGGGAFSGKKRLRVSGRRDLKMCLAAYWSAQGNRIDDKIYYGDLSKLRGSVANFRCNGASALDMAYVASGRYDMFYQQDVKAWDIAAGVLLVKEAGGDVAGFGKSKDPVYAGGILATNAALMAPVKELLGVK